MIATIHLIRFLCISFQTDQEIQNKIDTHIMACIRTGLETTRLCAILNECIYQDLGIKAGLFIGIDTGVQCTIAGNGAMFEAYKKNGKITNHTGFGLTPTTFYDMNFESAEIRLVKYDETYCFSPYDCSESKYLSAHLLKNQFENISATLINCELFL